MYRVLLRQHNANCHDMISALGEVIEHVVLQMDTRTTLRYFLTWLTMENHQFLVAIYIYIYYICIYNHM